MDLNPRRTGKKGAYTDALHLHVYVFVALNNFFIHSTESERPVSLGGGETQLAASSVSSWTHAMKELGHFSATLTKPLIILCVAYLFVHSLIRAGRVVKLHHHRWISQITVKKLCLPNFKP